MTVCRGVAVPVWSHRTGIARHVTTVAVVIEDLAHPLGQLADRVGILPAHRQYRQPRASVLRIGHHLLDVHVYVRGEVHLVHE
jgi:hypothetical protein